MALDRVVVDQDCPAASADLIALVGTFPGDLHAWSAAPLDWAAAQLTVDGDETELAGPVRAKST